MRHTDAWSTIKLAEPVHEAISPAVGLGGALYQAGNAFYAYSSERGAWDVLKLAADAKSRRNRERAFRQPTSRSSTEIGCIVFSFDRQMVAGRDDEIAARNQSQGRPGPRRTVKAMIQPASSRSRRIRSSACSGVSSSGSTCRSSLRSGSGSAANRLF